MVDSEVDSKVDSEVDSKVDSEASSKTERPAILRPARDEKLPAVKTGIPRLIAASKYSAQGLSFAFKNEEAFRLEVIGFVLLAPLGLWLGDGGIEKVLLVGSVVLVILVELLNTAIEVLVDRIGAEYHQLSGAAKDIGSACVLMSIGLVLFTWGVLLLT